MKDKVTESVPSVQVSTAETSTTSWSRTLIEATALLTFIAVMAFLL